MTLVGEVISKWWPFLMLGVFGLKRRWQTNRCMISKHLWSRLLSNRSCGTLMSYSNPSAQRCFKLNTPI